MCQVGHGLPQHQEYFFSTYILQYNEMRAKIRYSMKMFKNMLIHKCMAKKNTFLHGNGSESSSNIPILYSLFAPGFYRSVSLWSLLWPNVSKYRAGLKSGPQVVRNLEASRGRSGKQKQEQNSINLGSTFHPTPANIFCSFP